MRETRLSLFCLRFIEAGWLFAACLVPLFFNVFSNRVFEPDKLTLLRAIVLLMVAAWLIRAIETFEGPRQLRQRTQRFLSESPLALPAVLFLGVMLVSTALSVAPDISFVGSYQRLQGTLTSLAYLGLFWVMAVHLRTRAQVDRLVAVIILTSVPIGLYGILQHLQADPLPWGGDVTTRVTSTMGNAIFLSAYLIMVVPLTLARLGHALLALLARWANPGAAPTGATAWLLPLFYSSALALQLVAILFTKSRGPWIGLGLGLATFALLLQLRHRRWRLLAGTVGAVAAAGLFVLALNLPGSPLAPLKNLSPYLERLGSVLETEGGTGRVRVLIWFGDEIGRGALGLITSNPWRTIVGHGPESMYVAYNRFYPPDLAHYEARNAIPDRSHNDLLDALVTTGVLGLSAYLVLVGSFFLYGLTALWRAESWFRLLHLTAFMAAVAGHLGEAFFGIGIAATRTYFWLYLALLTCVLRWQQEEAEQTAARPSGAPTPRLALALPGNSLGGTMSLVMRRDSTNLVSALGLVIGLGVALTTLLQLRDRDFLMSTVFASLAGLGTLFAVRQGGLAARRWLLGATAAPLPAVAEPAPAARRPAGRRPATAPAAYTLPADDEVTQPAWSRPGLYLVIAYLLLTIFGFWSLLNAGAILQTEPSLLILGGFAWLVAGLFVTTTWVPVSIRTAPKVWARRVTPHLPLVLVSGYLAAFPLLGVVIADTYFKRGQAFEQARDFPTSAQAYMEAIRWDPRQDWYFLFLGRSLMELARNAPPGEKLPPPETFQDLAALSPERLRGYGKEDLLRASLVALRHAYNLSPLNTDNSANLARLHRFWAEATSDEELRRQRFAAAEQLYEQATALSPNAAHVHAEWGLLLAVQGKAAEAAQRYASAARLDDRYPPTFAYLGDLAAQQGKWQEAIPSYQRALELDKGMTNVRNGLAFGLVQVGEMAAAQQQYLILAEQQPNDFNAHYNLAIASQQMGDLPTALTAARRALAVAPEAQRPAVQTMVAALESGAPRRP